MHLESPVFHHDQAIPVQYTGDSRDLSPPLRWDDPREPAAAFALLVEDPDAPTDEPWVHWIAYNIPGTARELPEGLPRSTRVPDQGGFRQGLNSFPDGNIGYRGPFPPQNHGAHHYHFHLYALRQPLHVDGKVSKRHLLRAMQQAGIIEEAELVGCYARSSRELPH